MNADYQPIVDAFIQLGETVKISTTETRSAQEIAGNSWNFPGLDKYDLAHRAFQLALFVKSRAPDELGDSPLDASMLLLRIKNLETYTVPYCFNGNGSTAIPIYMTTLDGMQAWMESFWPVREVIEQNSLPSKLARESRTAKARLTAVFSELGEVETHLKVILAAHQAAEALPTDLEDLKQLRATLIAMNGQSAIDSQAVAERRDKVQEILGAVQIAEKTAQQLVLNCEEAYRITTTKGLASAFDQRAESLARSVRIWVGGLVFALLAVAFIGHDRVNALSTMLASEARWGYITLNLLLSIVSVGAPLWFAWVSTKQIGQRFRLSEDYGFKASVAKAYEGYRKEAVRIDPKFEAELFGIALSRLDEEPLRLVETVSHGSPWHELLEAAQRVPGFREKATQLAKDALEKRTIFKTNAAPQKIEVDEPPST